MRLLFLALFLTIGSVSSSFADVQKNKIEIRGDWYSTTGYHSDGTSASIQYEVDSYGSIINIEIGYNGSWYSTYIKHDSNNRRYVKNPNNKRYYF